MSLPALNVQTRLDRLRVGLDEAGVDGLLVTNLANVRYLTGFTGSAGLLAVTPGAALLTTDGRYRTQSSQQVAESGAAVEIEIGGAEAQRESIKTRLDGLGRVGLEADSVSWSASRRWADLLAGAELVPTSGVVEALREVKDDGELARMARAAAIADAALAEVLPMLADAGRTPITEEQFGLELDTAMRRRGAEGTAFETIVAAGANSAKPHHRPAGTAIRPGDPVVVDFGAIFEGYHGTGHGVGLDIHEAPTVAPTGTAILKPGFVVTVEPGVYLPGVGGVRIEDTLVVTEEGNRPLTHFPKHISTDAAA